MHRSGRVVLPCIIHKPKNKNRGTLGTKLPGPYPLIVCSPESNGTGVGTCE